MRISVSIGKVISFNFYFIELKHLPYQLRKKNTRNLRVFSYSFPVCLFPVDAMSKAFSE